MPTTSSASLGQNILATQALYCNSLHCTNNVCAMFIGPDVLEPSHHQLKRDPKCPHLTMTKQGCFKPCSMTCVIIHFSIASEISTIIVCQSLQLPIPQITSTHQTICIYLAPQWAFFSSHCSINQERDGDHLTDYKERQEFITLLILQHVSNFQSLSYHIGVSSYQWPCTDGEQGIQSGMLHHSWE